MAREPGIDARARPSDASRARRRCACALPQWRSMRSASVLMPRSVRKQSNGLGTPPTAFCRKASCSCELGVLAHDGGAADDIRMAVQILGGRVHDDVEADAPAAAAPTGEAKVLSHTERMPAPARQLRDSREIDELQQRIGRRLDPDSAYSAGSPAPELCVSVRSTKRDLQARRALAHALEEAVAAAIQIVACATMCEPESSSSSTVPIAAMPEANAKPRVAAFEIGDAALRARRASGCACARSRSPCARPGLDCA